MADGICISDECEASINKIDDNGLRTYVCEDEHENKRRIYHDEVETFEENGETGHYTGAVVMYDQNGMMYMQERAAAPEGWTIAAGHIDKGEDPETSARRELEEETGVMTSKVESELEKLAETILYNDKCTKGADFHEWHIYTLEIDREKIEIQISEESRQYDWFSPEEIREENLTPAMEQLYDKGLLNPPYID